VRKIALLIVLLAVAGTVAAWLFYGWEGPPRKPRPPVGATPSLPSGAVMTEGPLPVDQWRIEQRAKLAKRIGDGPKQILVISGGGARGAFGAGILTGWSETGERPDFDVVTGVSVGSLQSVFAFLGKEYDPQLKKIFAHHQHLSNLSLWESPRGAVSSVKPFEKAIRQSFNSDVIDAVAHRYHEGKFLFVGTTNLDASEFVLWDMGAIASSDRPDAKEHFQSVLLASCSMPMIFPPKFFEVEVEGETYKEMHVDGGVRSPLFLPEFVVQSTSGRGTAYIIVNHTIKSSANYHPIGDSLTSIGFASFRTLLNDKLSYSLRSSVFVAEDYELECKIVGMPAEWGGNNFSIRPEYAVKDPKKLFEKARNMMKEDPWESFEYSDLKE
jgi:predicted acylesterase/phospholipase RssA